MTQLSNKNYKDSKQYCFKRKLIFIYYLPKSEVHEYAIMKIPKTALPSSSCLLLLVFLENCIL